jgi:hypothetical protein
MRRYLSHDLEKDRDQTIVHQAKTYLAIVDLESYPSFAGEGADHLDLLSHLCGETQALHAVMWETPAAVLNLRFLFTRDLALSNQLMRTHRLVFDGCVRTTSGQLCLTDDEGLLATGRQRDRDLLHGKAAPDIRCPRLLNVPPGVISVGVFCGRPRTSDAPELSRSTIDYTILMRHYPLPAPRVAPMRISGGLIPWAGEEPSEQAWGGRHAA